MSKEYIAGFFDGEGCISVGSNGSLQVRVINTCLAALKMFEATYGGVVKDRKQIVNKKQYYWGVYGEQAVEFLEDIRPLLIEKRDQADTALMWMQEREAYPSIQRVGRGRVAHPERQTRINHYRNILTKQKLGTYIDE